MTEKVLWFFIFGIVYVSFCLFWAIRGSRLSDNSVNYYLASRNISAWVFFFAATAATFAGFTILSQVNVLYIDGFQYLGTAFISITIPSVNESEL